MSSIWTWLAGRKTYISAVALGLTGVGLWIGGDPLTGIQDIAAAATAAGLRSALSTELANALTFLSGLVAVTPTPSPAPIVPASKTSA